MPEVEVLWPAGDRAAKLDREWGDRQGDEKWAGLMALWFLSPETEGWHAGHRCFVIVSTSTSDAGTEVGGQNVWRIAENGDGTVTVSPSIHFVGHFHSPKPVRFHLVDTLGDEDDD